MNPRELEQDIIEDGDERKVATLLGSLARVEAPSNFEFGVRARIANGAPAEPSGMFRFVKIAAPLGLLLTVGAGVLFYGSLPGTDVASVPEVNTVVNQDRPVQRDVPPSQEIATETETPRVSGPNAGETVASVRPEEQQQRIAARPGVSRNSDSANSALRRPSSDTATQGGSHDITQGIPKIITPKGIGGDIPVQDVLNRLGIKAEFVNNGWNVRSASEGSLAHKSGFQAGDVIESIDGLAVSDKTSFKGVFSGKVFGVRRDGKPIEIKLGN